MYNLVNIFSYTDSFRNAVRPQRDYLMALDRYVSSHKKDPGFVLLISPDDPMDQKYLWRRRGDASGKKYSVPELLYPKYYKEESPGAQ
jgi:hypothetical protein